MPDRDKQIYAGLWLTTSEPHLGYRVLPKCGCSSIGQVLHHLDHESFYHGDIHDPAAPILKWKHGGNVQIREICTTRRVFHFTMVRNPYRRLLSSFTDKVFGFQPNGKRYRSGEILEALKQYDFSWGPHASIIINFRKFVQFVADTVEREQPMEPDIHWAPCFDQLQFSARNALNWSLEFVGQIEHFQRDLDDVMRRAGVNPKRVPPTVPRENTTSLPPIAIQNFYGPEEIDTMTRVYARDFELFGYGPDPADTKPFTTVNAAAVNAAMRGVETSPHRIPVTIVEPKEDVIELNGVKILIEKECLSVKMMQVLATGEYEKEEAQRIPRLITRGERIVELGGGVGYISSLCAANTHVQSVTVFEAHPDLIPVIERTHELNGVRSRIIHSIVLPKADKPTVPFYLRADFWASSLHPEPYGYERVVDVPVVPLAKVLADYRPTMLIVDIEGGEAMLFNNVALPGVRKVYLEVHPDVLGVAGVKKIFEFFAARQFQYDEWNSSNNGVVFKRIRGRAMNPQTLWNRYLRRWLKKVTPPVARQAARRLVGPKTSKAARQTAGAATKPSR